MDLKELMEKQIKSCKWDIEYYSEQLEKSKGLLAVYEETLKNLP